MKHPILRRLMYLGFQGLRALARILPAPAVPRVGDALGLAAYGLLWDQRRLTLRHLELAWGPELPAGRRRRVARGAFMNLGRNALEWLRLPSLSLRDVQRFVRAEGVEHLRTALAQGNGAIVVTAHFGNWELIPLYLKSVGFDGGVLARRLRYPEYESFIIALRGQKGIPTFARGSVKEVARLLRANQLIGMLPDQDTDSLEGVFVSFFGRPTYTPVGPAALSLMTGAPIIPCFMIREGAGFHFVVEPPVALPAGTDRSAALPQLTQAWSAVVERYIRRYPDHWVWMHRRWKTQPPSSAPQPAVAPPAAPSAAPSHPIQSAIALMLLGLLAGSAVGCAKRPAKAPESAAADAGDRQMTEFMLTGYQQDGSKKWELKGRGAVADGPIVTIHHPDAIGYDAARTGYLTASAAQVQQASRRVRLEHDVTIHTSDGLWFSTPVLHWLPDQNHVETDDAVRIETDHMLLRGRRMTGSTQLKQATIASDIELVLNPSDHEPGQAAPQHVTITCEGPLSFDYEHHTATFEHDVHVRDPNGDLYSDTLVAYLDPVAHTIRYAEASGHVRIHQQQNTATSERAVYEPALGKITLVGQPSLLIYPESGGSSGPMTLGGLVAAKPSATSAPAPQQP